MTYHSRPGYIELPVAIGLRHRFDNGLSVFGETGPYFAVGVCGKHQINHVNYKNTDFFGGKTGAHLFHSGGCVLSGIEYNNFQVHAGYEYGFSKIWDTEMEEDGCHNSSFSVGVTYK